MTAISSVLALVAAWFLIPWNNVGGVAIASSVYTVGQLLFYYLYYWPKVLDIDSKKIFATVFLPIAFVGCSIWFLISYIPHFNNHWLNVFVFGVLFTVIYMVYCLFYLSKEDKKYLLGLIKIKSK